MEGACEFFKRETMGAVLKAVLCFKKHREQKKKWGDYSGVYFLI